MIEVVKGAKIMGLYIDKLHIPKDDTYCFDVGLTHSGADLTTYSAEGMNKEDIEIIDMDIVRCKDCKYFDKGENESESWSLCTAHQWYGSYIPVSDDDFCSLGERKKPECCANCKFKMDLQRYDYRRGGCKHTKYDGWACMMDASEGTIIHMVGLNEFEAHCEMFAERAEE